MRQQLTAIDPHTDTDHEGKVAFYPSIMMQDAFVGANPVRQKGTEANAATYPSQCHCFSPFCTAIIIQAGFAGMPPRARTVEHDKNEKERSAVISLASFHRKHHQDQDERFLLIRQTSAFFQVSDQPETPEAHEHCCCCFSRCCGRSDRCTDGPSLAVISDRLTFEN